MDAGDGPHRARHERVQANAEAAGVQRADLAIHQPPRLRLAHHQRPRGAEEKRGAVCADRAGFRRRARHAARAVGRRIGIWRSAGAAEPHEAGIPLARSARLTRADGKPFPQPGASAQMWVPVAGGPAFLLGPNFYSVKSYNPSMNYALAICHLGDRILGAPPFLQPFPGSERALTLAEVQEMQVRLTKAGFDTGGTDGRVGNDTMKAVRDYQTKMGILPA